MMIPDSKLMGAGRRNAFFLIIFYFCLFSSVTAMAQPAPEADQDPAVTVTLLEPQEGSTTISKKPLVRFSISGPYSKESLIVIIDGIDFTSILAQDGDRFSFRPIEPLPAGPHSLQVICTTSDGNQQAQEIAFDTRHSEIFEEAYSQNEIGVSYRYRVEETDNMENELQYRLDSNLSSVSRIKEKNFDATLSFNMRDFRQDLPVEPPEKRFNLANYLLESNYVHNDMLFHTELGDVQINESERTVQGLARRGGQFGVEYQEYSFNSFVVKSEELFGFEGGMGIGTSTDDHIIGVSAARRFFSDRLSLKGIYVTGGEQNDSYSEFSEGSKRKGDVVGIVLCADLFDNLIQIEGEYASAEFDPDTSDEFSAERDKSYGLRVSGYYGNYNWGISYGYFGPDFEVIGNPYGERDQEVITFEGGANYAINSINVSFSQREDNVEEDDLYAQTKMTDIMIDYMFTKFQNFQIGANYQRSMQRSSNEPAPDAKLKTYTDTYSGNISYTVWYMNLSLQATHSYLDDKTINDLDTSNKSYTLTPALTFEHVSLCPSFGYNISEDEFSGVDTDTYTAAFNLYGDTFWDGLRYDVSGTYNWIETNDDTIDDRTFDADFSISYQIPGKVWRFENSTVALEGRYGRRDDRVLHDDDHERVIFLTFSTNLPIIF